MYAVIKGSSERELSASNVFSPLPVASTRVLFLLCSHSILMHLYPLVPISIATCVGPNPLLIPTPFCPPSFHSVNPYYTMFVPNPPASNQITRVCSIVLALSMVEMQGKSPLKKDSGVKDDS